MPLMRFVPGMTVVVAWALMSTSAPAQLQEPPNVAAAVSAADGRLALTYARGETADIADAVAGARSTFDAGVWSRLPAARRAAVLQRNHQPIRLEARNCGIGDAEARAGGRAADPRFVWHAVTTSS